MGPPRSLAEEGDVSGRDCPEAAEVGGVSASAARRRQSEEKYADGLKLGWPLRYIT